MDSFEFGKDVNLKDFCTFHIGGNAKFLFIAKSTKTLLEACQFATDNNIKFKVIGLGANLLFDNEGYNGLIIVNQTNKILFRKGIVYVESGVNVTNLIMKCYMRSLSGLENLAGIPATVGGAVVNSLGAFDTNFSDFVEYVECYNINDLTKKKKLTNKDCKFGYRTSLFKSGNYIITKVKLKLSDDNKPLIQQRIKEAIEKKKSTQPLNYPSAGSVFKRTKIIPAKVIDELNLKGRKIGGAEISTKHAGFIVNTNSATSEDVKELITLIQEKVKTTHNENLEPEIEFVEY